MKQAVIIVFALAFFIGAAHDATISIDVRDAPLSDVLIMLAAQSGKDIIADAPIGRERVTLRLRDANFDQVIELLARERGLRIIREGPLYLLAFAVRSVHRPAPQTVAGPPVRERRLPAIVIASPLAVAAQSRDADVAVRAIRLRFLKASKAIAALRDVLPAATYVPDDATKSVGILADDATLQTASRLVKMADGPVAHIVLDVRVVDVHLIEDEDNIGQELSETPVPNEPGLYDFVKNTASMESGLRFLLNADRVEPLMEWRTATLSDHNVAVAVGRDFGMHLNVKPTIYARDLVLSIEVVDRVPQKIVGRGTAFRTRQANFTVTLQPNQSLVVGGLFKGIDGRAIAAAPALGELPALNAIFASRYRAHIKDELCLILTARAAGEQERGSRSH